MPDDIDLNFILGGEASGLVPRVAALEVGLEAIAETKELNMVAGCISEFHMPMWLQMRASWYSEPLGTVTRGTRRDMPTRLVVIAESNTITLFDGDDPDFPMWMVFERGAGKVVLGPPTSVAMRGNVLVAGNDAGSALFEIDFSGDCARWVYSPGIRYFDEPISGRNATGWTQGPTTGGIAGNFVHAVAMTALPDAPIDPATGLPVPTTAVGTDGGVSVVKHDGTVVNSAEAGAIASVQFDGEGTLWAGTSNASHKLIQAPPPFAAGFGAWAAYNSNVTSTYANMQVRSTHISCGKDTIAIGGSSAISGAAYTTPGLNILVKGSKLMALMTSTYNTGWMPGGIKGAWLCETEAGALLGSYSVQNGGFDTDLAGWTVVAPVVWDSGAARMGDGAGTAGQIKQLLVPAGVSGTFTVTWTQTLRSGTRTRLMCRNASDTVYVNNGSPITGNGYANGSGTFSTTMEITDGLLLVLSGDNSDDVDIDNVAISVAVPDRSVNAAPLTIVGTGLVSAPVAEGAELCAVSGFSETSYLEQPYNTGLDFGTGDFFAAAWVNPVEQAHRYIMEYRAPDGTGDYFRAYVDGNLKPVFGTTGRMLTSDRPLPLGRWSMVCCVRSAGVMSIYLDGVLAGSVSGSFQVSSPISELFIGRASGASPMPFAGAMTLLRIGATAPTPDQIRHMYETERRLFQPGAACTLEGTSDAVNALAHDPETGLLHIGTPDARSTFSGLTRVDETASGASVIAARGGMVLEG